MDWLTDLTGPQFKGLLASASGCVGLLWYYACLIDLGRRPTPAGTQSTGFRQFQSLSITTISTSLATYVGYVVGFPAKSEGVKNAANVVAALPVEAAASAASAVSAAGAASLQVAPLQAASAALYVGSLVLAVWFYYQKQDATEPAITGLAKSVLGFVAGVFSVSLNAPSAF